MSTRLTQAIAGSQLAAARVQGMKLRAEADRPTAAKGPFPWPHRTCAEWGPVSPHEGQPRKPGAQYEPRPWNPREMTDHERLIDARKGSEKLLKAIRRAG